MTPEEQQTMREENLKMYAALREIADYLEQVQPRINVIGGEFESPAEHAAYTALARARQVPVDMAHVTTALRAERIKADLREREARLPHPGGKDHPVKARSLRKALGMGPDSQPQEMLEEVRRLKAVADAAHQFARTVPLQRNAP